MEHCEAVCFAEIDIISWQVEKAGFIFYVLLTMSSGGQGEFIHPLNVLHPVTLTMEEVLTPKMTPN
jgi:hypothetical protein